MKTLIALALLASTVSGCAINAHCAGQQEYQYAYSLPQPEIQGLKMPTSSAALVIPPPVPQMVPYAYKATDGKGEKNGVSCLDAPPKLTLTPNKS